MSVRPDLHDNSHLNLYIDGMNKSKGDKSRIIPFVQGDLICELGCGDGVVLDLIGEELPSANLIGIDASGRLLGAAANRCYEGEKPVLVRQDVIKELPTGQYDCVVACSFLHEIYSVMVKAGNESAFFDWLKKLVLGMTKQGGRFVIRDGVKPESETLKIRFLDPEVKERWFMFADDFAMKFIEFSFDAAENIATVNSQDFFEFATKFFYRENWAIEMQETFGWATCRFLSNVFPAMCDDQIKTIHSETYTIPFLREERWAGNFDILRADGSAYNMATTMIVVYERL